MTCVIDGCAKPAYVKVRGFCRMHYMRWNRHGDPLVVKNGGGQPRYTGHTCRSHLKPSRNCYSSPGCRCDGCRADHRESMRRYRLTGQVRGPEFVADQAWRERAACLDVDTELFFADLDSWETGQAKQVCAGCDVREACLADALRTGDLGVRGGLDERERRRLRKRGVAA